mmetsp:Transcript_12609/g.22034  ORF Transcript_12609/g.22034 Transcript_12609/m.22034 type:complete len:232 (+) Transcript_12609:1021-1716(+)
MPKITPLTSITPIKRNAKMPVIHRPTWKFSKLINSVTSMRRSGNWMNSLGKCLFMIQSIRVMAKMPIKIPPCTWWNNKLPMSTKPMMDSQISGEWISPSPTMVSLLGTTSFTEVMPTRAICNPMPTIVASLTERGISFITTEESPVTDRNSSTIPATKHAVKASCTDKPVPITKPYVKYALRPIPGARPRGRLPKYPATNDPTKLASAVLTTTAVGGIPILDKSCGFTNRM